MNSQPISFFHKRTMRMFSFVAILCIPFLSCRVRADTPLTAIEILDRYAAAQDKLKSFIIKEEKILIEARTTMLPMSVPTIKGDGKPTAIIESRSDGQRAKWSNRMWGHIGLARKNTPPEEAAFNVRLWDGKASFQYNSSLSAENRASLHVQPGNKQHNEDEVGGALRGFFILAMDGRVDAILRENGTLSVSPKPTILNGGSCQLLEGRGKYGHYQVWFDADHDWQIAKANFRKEPGDLYGGRAMQPDTMAYYALEDIRFERIDGVWVPMEAVEREIQQVGKGQKYESRQKIHRTEVLLNPDHDALGSFEPTEIKDGARLPFYLNTTGPHDNVDPDFVWMRNSPFHVDAQGRLPKAPGIATLYPIVKRVRGLDILAGKDKWERSSTKPVLLCFWDVAQPGSQSTVRQLVSKTDELAERGVGVLLVETEPGNRKQADNWVKDNQVPFVSGGFPPHDYKNPVSARITEWRIDRIPWLVLANAGQIIVAEGFELTQLPEMLKRLAIP